MKRTGEKVLGIISIILNLISIFGLIFIIFISAVFSSNEFKAEIYDDTEITEELTDAEIEYGLQSLNDSFNFAAALSYAFLIGVVVSIVLTIISILKIDNNAKNAGIMLIISSILSALISLQGILLLIAGIMALVRKPKEPDTTIAPLVNE